MSAMDSVRVPGSEPLYATPFPRVSEYDPLPPQKKKDYPYQIRLFKKRGEKNDNTS